MSFSSRMLHTGCEVAYWRLSAFVLSSQAWYQAGHCSIPRDSKGEIHAWSMNIDLIVDSISKYCSEEKLMRIEIQLFTKP